MTRLRIKNWSKHQHFKDRTPPWIKLYREILDDPDWHELDGDTSKVLVSLWLIASEDETHQGVLPEPRRLAFRLRISESALNQAINKLSHWLIRDDIGMISERFQSDAPERAPEETETETETYKEETEKRALESQLFPGVTEQVVSDFKKLRSRLKAPITATAIAGIQREANKAGVTLEFALTKCCERSWRGFEAAWVDKQDARPRPASVETRNKASVADWVPPEMRETA